MKRRSFFNTTAEAAALFGCRCGCADNEETEQTTRASSAIGTIGTYSLKDIRNRYEHYLFEDFVPFHDKYVIDHTHGSYMATTDHDGSHPNTNTSSAFMGRGIWCYSFLYNNLAKEDKYLDIASRGVDFIMKHKPSGTKHWPASYTCDGQVIGDGNGSWSGDCYIAEGLAEYSKATGDTHYLYVARETIFKCLSIYDREDYMYRNTYPGSRNMWYWMLLMWFGTCVLMEKDDTELQALVDRCIDSILHHINPKFDLIINIVNHDLSLPEDPKYSESADICHAIEATWMIMYEAVRRKDKALFEKMAGIFKRHAQVGKDDVYGGYYSNCTNVDENTWRLSKVSFVQAFILINSLYIVEHTSVQWAKDIFGDQFAWCEEHLPLKKYGFDLWLEPRDRFATFQPHAGRKDNYHHPRHLMLNLASARRMVERGGKISGIFL